MDDIKTNYIKCGDSSELLKDIPDQCIDLTVTSPPYDNLRTYNGFTWDFNKIANELYRVTKQGGVVVWIIADAVVNGSETGTSFRQALYFQKIGFNIHDTMIWAKDTFSFPDNYRYGQAFEYMFVFSKGLPKCVHKIRDKINKYANVLVHGTSRGPDGITFRKSNDKKSCVQQLGERFNVWNLPGEKHNVTGHPAPFPVCIAKDHILSWSNEGDIVLDPFIGSGTTAVAAIQSKRKYIGFEISQTYCDMAQKRIDKVLSDTWFSKSLF